MNLVVASDRGGFPLKGRFLDELRKSGHQAENLGAYSDNPTDDYPDFSRAVAEAIQQGRAERAILICGSGAGACGAANKFRGIRASPCHDSFSARQCVEDDNVNVMCLGARVVGSELAVDLVRTYVPAILRRRASPPPPRQGGRLRSRIRPLTAGLAAGPFFLRALSALAPCPLWLRGEDPPPAGAPRHAIW